MTNVSATSDGKVSGPSIQSQPEISMWKPMFVFFLVTIALAIAGYTIFQQRKEDAKTNAQHDLAAIGGLKIAQVANWMKERKGDAYALSTDPLFLAEFDRWLQRGGPDDEVRTRLIKRMVLQVQAYNTYGYTSISLFDNHGIQRLSSSAAPDPIDEYDRQLMLESMRDGQIVFSDIHQSGRGIEGEFEIDIAASLMIGKGKQTHAIGTVLFHMDPYTFLFPLIQNWPTPSPSAENLLVRRDGDQVVFLNQLRHLKNTPLTMRFPLSRQQLLAAQVAVGQTGLTEGVDYRGMPVIGVLNKVPDTPWLMVSKIDQAEIYGPLNQLADRMVMLMLALIGAESGLFIYLRKKEKKHYESELKRHALEKHLDYLSKYANDIILLHDRIGKIINYNDRALMAYGYTAAEFADMNFSRLQAAPTATLEELINRTDTAGSLRFESKHVREDGTVFPVETSVQRIEVDGEVLYQDVIRDITERKLAENALNQFKYTLDQTLDSIFMFRESDFRFIYVNEGATKHLGYSRNELLKMTPLDIMPEFTLERFQKMVQPLHDGVLPSLIFETVHRHKNGGDIPVEIFLQLVRDGENEPRFMAIVRDIAARKLADRQLRELTAHLHTVREEERTRIARELHDELGQSMTALRFDLKWLDENVDVQERHIRERLRTMNNLVTTTVDAIRRISEDLRPGILDDLGLAAAIESYAGKFSTQYGIRCDFSISHADFDLDQQVATALFRLVQEGLTNVARHSGASHVFIRLQEIEEGVLLIVQDNGRGLPSVQDAHKKTYGLRGMRERITMLGGTLDVFNEKGAGVRIEAFTPKQVKGE